MIQLTAQTIIPAPMNSPKKRWASSGVIKILAIDRGKNCESAQREIVPHTFLKHLGLWEKSHAQPESHAERERSLQTLPIPNQFRPSIPQAGENVQPYLETAPELI